MYGASSASSDTAAGGAIRTRILLVRRGACCSLCRRPTARSCLGVLHLHAAAAAGLRRASARGPFKDVQADGLDSCTATTPRRGFLRRSIARSRVPKCSGAAPGPLFARCVKERRGSAEEGDRVKDRAASRGGGGDRVKERKKPVKGRRRRRVKDRAASRSGGDGSAEEAEQNDKNTQKVKL